MKDESTDLGDWLHMCGRWGGKEKSNTPLIYVQALNLGNTTTVNFVRQEGTSFWMEDDDFSFCQIEFKNIESSRNSQWVI